MNRSLEARLWAKVDCSAGRDGCWVWVGATDGRPDGSYGRMRVGPRALSRFVRPHRVSYEIAYGPIPEGYSVHHLCENKLCVNPTHLEAVSPTDHSELHAAQLVLEVA